MSIKALTFDTGGTVLDWHGGLVRAMEQTDGRENISADWPRLVNDWRRRSMKGIVGQVAPDFNMDDVHARSLDECLEAAGLHDIPADARARICAAWHAVDCWPDFPPALSALRARYVTASFTMLPTSLVIDVSRKNRISWDAIISCEMIGTYKPHRAAYLTAARWLNLDPSEILMVACHNFDLNAAHSAGFRTAFIRRPREWGIEPPPEPEPNMAYDFIEEGFEALAERLLA